MIAWKLITGIVMAAGVGVWIIWDIVVAANGVPGDTISEITMGLGKAAPLIPLAVGIIAGHLFASFDFLTPTAIYLRAHPLIPLLTGVVLGALFWYQGK